MNFFTIPDSGKWEIPLDQSHYYAWLNQNPPNDITNHTKTDYLNSIGFKRGEQIITEDDLTLLKACESFYFDQVIKPVIEARFRLLQDQN